MEIIKYESVKNIKSLNYFNGDNYSSDVFNAKYSETVNGEYKTPGEVFWNICTGLSENEELREIWFSLLWEGWFRPGGSVIAGVGSGKKCSLNNCTSLIIQDDTLEAIAKTDYDLMKVAAYRQGVGFDASRLRPRGSKVGNAAEESTGVVPWIDKLTNISKYVGQKGRMPALLVSLKIEHPDIEEFISCKDDKTKITSANISVQISDKFMETVLNDGDWELYFKIEDGEEIKKIVSAKKLFRYISEHAHFSAEPGVQYIDLMRSGSMVQCIAESTGIDKYIIQGTNACSEKPLAPYSVCNLLSINMEKFSTTPEKFKKELKEIVPYLVKMSDCVIDYEITNNLSPLSEQKFMVESLREIGLGITNIHGWLLKENLPYDSEEAVKLIEEFQKYYSYCVFNSSIKLGLELGNAPAFDLVKDKSAFMQSTYFSNIINEFYNGDYTNVTHMRNMAHMSIAPTGSLSSIFPTSCISSGIEPVIGLYYWRKTRAIDKGNYTYYFIIPNRLKDFILTFIPQNTDEWNIINNFSGSAQDDDGKIGKSIINIINKYVPKNFFKPAHEIDPIKKIKMMGKVYKWVDAAISCTYNLPPTSSVEDVENIYMEAWKHGVRAVSIYVEGSREGILIFEDPITNKNKYEKNISACLERPKDISYVCSPKRPNTLSCSIHHCTIKGTPWLVIVGTMNDKPYEIFAGEGDDLYIPKTCKEGKIVKQPGGTYSLEISIRNTEVVYKDLANILMNSEQRALTRILSLSMRHGCPLEFVQKQLKKADGEISDFSSVIARVIGGYIKQWSFSKESNICPICNEATIVKDGSCTKCINEKCNYSRCE